MHRFSGVLFIAPTWLPIPRMRGYHRAIARLDRLVRAVIARRRERGAGGGKDLLSMLLHVQDEDGSKMSDTQLRDEVLTLLLAGHETTSNALTWGGYLLSFKPEIQSRLFDEARALGGPPTAAYVPGSIYTEAGLNESIRLYPPAWALGREVTEPFQLAGRELAEGTRVIVTPWVVHHDERWYRDPLEFRPERWLD